MNATQDSAHRQTTAAGQTPGTVAGMRLAVLKSPVGRAAQALARWAKDAGVTYLSNQDVPGANAGELSALSALGAVAGALGGNTGDMPKQVRDWIAHASITVPEHVLEQAAGPSAHEILALAYELLVSGPNRRVLGTFFTPEPIVAHMLTLCETDAGTPDLVVDPGAGVGAFSHAALHRWPQAQVQAIDINPVTLGLMTAAIPASTRARLDMTFENYLTWATTENASGSGSRLTCGNPPYTRHQHMTAADKATAQSAAGELVSSGLAGLSTYFAATTIRTLGPQDSACLLLPGNWCQARYGRELRLWLWGAHRRHVRIQMFPPAAEVFPGTQVTAMVLYVGPQKSRTQPLRIEELALARTGDGGAALAVTQVSSVVKDRTKPCPDKFTAQRARPNSDDTDDLPTVRLSDIAKVRRGVATGVNKFFFLTDEVADTLPKDVIKPALVKASQAPNLHLTQAVHQRIGNAGGQRWLLAVPDTYRVHGALASYLRIGESEQYDQRHLTQSRAVWYSVEKVRAPDLFIAPFAQGAHRVIVNDINAIGSNNLYGIYLEPTCAWNAAKLARWLLSEQATARIAASGRAYQGRSHKLEPGDVRALLVPADAHRRPEDAAFAATQLALH